MSDTRNTESFAATKTAIAADFATRQPAINAEPEAIRDTWRWINFGRSVEAVYEAERRPVRTGDVHMWARALGVN